MCGSGPCTSGGTCSKRELEGQWLILPARRLADDGLNAWQEVLAHGFEGLMAKDPHSLMWAGAR